MLSNFYRFKSETIYSVPKTALRFCQKKLGIIAKSANRWAPPRSSIFWEFFGIALAINMTSITYIEESVFRDFRMTREAGRLKSSVTWCGSIFEVIPMYVYIRHVVYAINSSIRLLHIEFIRGLFTRKLNGLDLRSEPFRTRCFLTSRFCQISSVDRYVTSNSVKQSRPR